MARSEAAPKPKAAPSKTRAKGEKAADEVVKVIDDDNDDD
jgi:hypothetical protein